MRSDMHEVVIERPRWGSSRGYQRAYMLNRFGRDVYDSPRREAMGACYREKSLSENLAPLRRFLLSNVGRPWAKVHSEIAAEIRVTSAVQKHVLDHLRWFVCETTFLRDGAVWGADAYGRPRPFGGAEFWVHPRSGLLATAARSPRKLASRLRVANPDVRSVRGHFLRRIGGVWHEVILAPMPAGEPVWDAFARAQVSRFSPHADAHAEAQWKGGHYARSLRRLTPRERRQLLGG